MEIYTL